jgi:hypothetical protein
MKQFIIAFVVVLLATFNTSCSTSIITETGDIEVYTVNLGWGGELDVTYEPLTRSQVSTDLYGVQVYSASTMNDYTDWEPYAYGLFDDSNNITINLIKGYQYKFVATMVKDGKNIVKYCDDRYYHPFFVENADRGQMVLDNTFYYSGTKFISGLNSGDTRLKDGCSYTVPTTERYYGVLEDYNAGQKNTTAKIKMKRVSFGAKFIVDGKLSDSGKLEVQVGGAPNVIVDITNENKQFTKVYTFNDIESAWEDNTYSQIYGVVINWHRNDGTVLPLGTHDITFKRNTATVIKVRIDNDGLDSGIGVEIEDGGEIPDGDEVIVQDGEVVETDVKIN